MKTPTFVGLTPASPRSSYAKRQTPKRDTRPELLLRKALHRLGLRYNVNVGRLAGRPDIAFRAARVAVFCDGDFWHGRHWRSSRRKLATGVNADYWISKIKANISRDRRNTTALEADGWLVIRLWEGEITADAERSALLVYRAVQRRLGKRNQNSVNRASLHPGRLLHSHRRLRNSNH